MPFYHNPQAVPQRPVQGVTQAPRPNPDRVPEKPNMINQLKEKAKAFNENVGLAGNTAKSIGTAASLASGLGAALNVADRLKAPTPRAKAYYPARGNQPDPTGKALDKLFLNYGIGSGHALGSSGPDIPASP